MHKLWDGLNEMKKLRWIDLTHTLTNSSPYWDGIPAGSVELGKPVFTWGNPALECEITTFKFPGQFGTHMDFPGHFIKGAATAEDFSVKHLTFPLCVLDISKQVAVQNDYAVTVEDIKAYEATHGIIPEGSFVALFADWAKGWPSMDALSGTANGGKTPGWSLEALKYIFEIRGAAANGHETLSTDSSAEYAKYGDLACERYVLNSGRVQIEVMCNLEQVPPAGAIIVCAVPNIVGANGLPVRAWAICE